MKKRKLMLILFILVPAISMSILLYTNKDNVGFSRRFVTETTFDIEGMTCHHA